MYKKLCIECGFKEHQELHDSHEYFPDTAKVYMDKCERCNNTQWIFTEDIWKKAIIKCHQHQNQAL